MTANNLSTGTKGKHIANKWFPLSLSKKIFLIIIEEKKIAHTNEFILSLQYCYTCLVYLTIIETEINTEILFHLTIILPIWITGSLSGSGKIPLRPAHSISNDRTRSGATSCQSPSGACEITFSHEMSNSN